LKKQARKLSIGSKKLTSRKKALLAIEAGRAAKAIDPVALKLTNLVDYTDYFVIMSGESTVQVRAIYEKVLGLISQTRSPMIDSEGENEARWIVVDWGDVVVHIFLRELREFYELEKLWADAPRLKIPKQSEKKI